MGPDKIMDEPDPTGGGIRHWMRKIEADLNRLDTELHKDVDHIENTIRTEIATLKSETIADLRRRIEEGYRTLERFDDRLREAENSLRDINTSRLILSGFTHFLVSAFSALAAFFGAKHLG